MSPKAARLKAITGGKSAASPVRQLFTGKVRRGAEPISRRRKREAPPQELPKPVQNIANLFVAGRVVEKEVKFKADYAKQELDQYCLRDFVKRFIAGNRRPPSLEYQASHSRFKFVLTSRTTMTVEKVEALHDLDLPIEKHTEMRGMRIDSDAVRQHGLEEKLIQALENLHVSKAVLEECFIPQVELKPTFYDMLVEIVRNSLKRGEDLEDKMMLVLETLNPAEQIRNTEAIGMDAKECFDYVYRAKVEASEDLSEEDRAG